MVSSFAVHHVPESEKGTLFRRIAASLAPGGWLFLLDALETGPVCAELTEAVESRMEAEPSFKAAVRLGDHALGALPGGQSGHVDHCSTLADLTALAAHAGIGLEPVWRAYDLLLLTGQAR